LRTGSTLAWSTIETEAAELELAEAAYPPAQDARVHEARVERLVDEAVVGEEVRLLHDEVVIDLDKTSRLAEAVLDLGDQAPAVGAPRDGETPQAVEAHPLPGAAIQGKEIAQTYMLVANITLRQFLSHLSLYRQY